MNILDFSTIYMAIITSNILLVIIALIIRKEKIMINAGYKLITVFLILTFVRFLLPFEVPFATTFPLPTGISNIIIEFFAYRFTFLGFNISIFRIVLLVWFIGILIQTYRYIRENRAFKRFIFTYGKKVNSDPRYLAILKTQSKVPYQIYEVPNISTPCLYGLATPYILIPKDLPYTDKELDIVLKHEMMHYRHHDQWVKFGVQLISIIYWWNPSGSALLNNMDMALDMRIDDTLTGMNKTQTLEYIRCLYRTAEYQNDMLNRKFGNFLAFSLKERTKAEKRFLMMTQKETKKHPWLNISITAIFASIYLFSYLFAFEAYMELYPDTFSADGLNSYIIDNEDGTYDHYLSGFKIETVTSLDFFDENIPVYTREEFEHVQQSNPE